MCWYGIPHLQDAHQHKDHLNVRYRKYSVRSPQARLRHALHRETIIAVFGSSDELALAITVVDFLELGSGGTNLKNVCSGGFVRRFVSGGQVYKTRATRLPGGSMELVSVGFGAREPTLNLCVFSPGFVVSRA